MVFLTPSRAWILYDGANSAFATVVLTFVYATFFTKSIAPDPMSGAAWWGYALGFSGFLLAILAPLCGVWVNRTGRAKTGLMSGLVVCALCTAGLWWATPHAPIHIIFTVLTFVVIANVAMELSQVCYNALLRRVTNVQTLGAVSAAGWGVGYAGGLVSLIIVLLGFVGLGGIEPLLSFPTEQAQHIRAAIVFIAVWMVSFALPSFIALPQDNVLTEKFSYQNDIKKLIHDVLHDKIRARFLIGSAIYRDGLNTVFAVGGIYAATRFDFSVSQILVLGVLLNVTAGLGCAFAIWAEKRFPSLHIIKFSLILLSCGFVITVLSPIVTIFYVMAAFCGLFIGPIQSSSRAYLASISPESEQAGQFGLYAFTGKALAFLGPILFAFVTNISGNVTYGFATCLIFFILGYMVIRPLKASV